MSDDEAMIGTTDAVKPWTLKAMPNEVRNLAMAAARDENLTVSQWLERRIREWTAGGHTQVTVSLPQAASSAADQARVRAVFEMAADMGRAGVPVQKGVSALLNRLVKRELADVLGVSQKNSLPHGTPQAAIEGG